MFIWWLIRFNIYKETSCFTFSFASGVTEYLMDSRLVFCPPCFLQSALCSYTFFLNASENDCKRLFFCGVTSARSGLTTWKKTKQSGSETSSSTERVSTRSSRVTTQIKRIHSAAQSRLRAELHVSWRSDIKTVIHAFARTVRVIGGEKYISWNSNTAAPSFTIYDHQCLFVFLTNNTKTSDSELSWKQQLMHELTM